MVAECDASPFTPMRYTFLFISVRWLQPMAPERATVQPTRAGCQAPMQAT